MNSATVRPLSAYAGPASTCAREVPDLSELLPVSKIRTDGGSQPRVDLDGDRVAEYAAEMERGDLFPPVTVFYDGTDHWLADGFRRLRATQGLQRLEIACDVRMGTRRDAILFSCQANAEHGDRRTNRDKQRAVSTLLRDEEWGAWSDGEIARRAKVDDKMVARLREELFPPPLSRSESEIGAPSNRTVARGGTVYQMDVSGIAAANKERVAGVREARMSTPEIALDQAIRAALLAFRSWPSPVLAARLVRVPPEEADRISAWWSDYSEELRERGWRSA